jgi:hypothetical protein
VTQSSSSPTGQFSTIAYTAQHSTAQHQSRAGRQSKAKQSRADQAPAHVGEYTGTRRVGYHGGTTVPILPPVASASVLLAVLTYL